MDPSLTWAFFLFFDILTSHNDQKPLCKAFCAPSLFVSHPIWPLGEGASWFMSKQFPASMGEKSKALKADTHPKCDQR